MHFLSTTGTRLSRLFGIVLITLGPALALGQTTTPEDSSAEPSTRRELLRREREAKKQRVAPYTPSRIEQELIRADKGETPTIADMNFKGFYPRIAWPARGSGAALGVRYWQRDVGAGTSLAGAAFYSWRRYQHYDIQYGRIPHIGQQIPPRSWRGDNIQELGDTRPGFSRFPFYVTARYRYLPQERFYGFGPNSDQENESRFLQEETRLYLKTGYQFTDRLVWIVSGGYQWNTIGDLESTRQEVFDDAAVSGSTGAPDYIRYGTQLLVDYRDEPGNPHQGFVVAVGVERLQDETVGKFSFERYGVDGRAFIPLGSRQRILALRAAWLDDEPRRGERVPFFMQASLGGSHNLRGFDSFRFTGPKAMLYQIEYRWEPSPLWELAIFVDTGTVSSPGSSLSFSDLKTDYGAGLRIKTLRGIVLRFDVAHSNETTRFLLRSSAVF